MILPGEINYYYLDYFRDKELLFLRESILKNFFESPYSPWSPVQISKQFMKAAYYHNATNGLIGDYYSNFGLTGLFIYPLLISFCFYTLRYFLRGFNVLICVVISFILMWMLVNTSFFTWLMTGGYLIYLVILFMYKKFNITKFSRKV